MSAASSKHDKIGFLLGIVGITAFAGSLPATRIAVAELDPWFVTSARATIAGFAAAIVLAGMRRAWPPVQARVPVVIVAIGVILFFPLFTALAMQTVPASHGGVVIGVLPLATAVAATLLAHERPSTLFWIASVAGAAIVIFFSLRESGLGAISAGDLWLLAAVVSAAVAYTLSGKLARTMPGWEVISWACLLALPVFAAGTAALWPKNFADVSIRAWDAVLYAGLIAQFLGFFAWNAGLAMGGIARVGQVQLLQPFITLVIAALLNGEQIEIDTILFASAVAATVLIGLRSRETPILPHS
jgi:drug/metabolite transporter (DMT)-like permease